MAPGPTYPSIQSFYKREVPKPAAKAEAEQEALPGEGFTEEELADALDPLNRKWNPQREYEETEIGDLIPGPRDVTFIGRIVNINTIYGRNPKQPKAAGWHYVLLKDNTAIISVVFPFLLLNTANLHKIKLYFSKDPYPLKLGHLLTVWTLFISDAPKADTTVISGVINYANLFPGRVTSDHIMIHTTSSTSSLCRTPLSYRHGQAIQGLMTVASYLSGGHDGVVDAKLLVCVKSIGARKKISTKSGKECELADLWLFDHTGEVKWTVWNETIDSVKEWEPGKTVLLLSNPGYRLDYSQKGTVGVHSSTMIDVDPQFPDSEWLRRHAAGMTRTESVALEFPEDVWDVDAAENGINRILYTLTEIDEL